MQQTLGNVQPSSNTVALPATTNVGNYNINSGDATRPLNCQALGFQALETNAGAVYICSKQNPDLTKDVHWRIPPPSVGPPVFQPGWVVGNPTGQNPINAAEYWILPANANDGVRITALIT